MNNTVEEEIIKCYVISQKQERILWELSSKRKRDNVFWHFSGPQNFIANCLQPLSCMFGDELEIFLQHLGANENVNYMGESYIGELSLREAVRKASSGEICIIYCGKGFAYYQGERELGNQLRFLLKADP